MNEPTVRRPTTADMVVPTAPSKLHDLSLRFIDRADLIAWAIPITNCARITRYLVSHKLYRDPELEQSIEDFLGQPASLNDVLDCFALRDATTVQAATFSLLAAGQIICPDIARAPLCGTTHFQHPIEPLVRATA